jgi:hypothetical protein
LTRVEDVDEPLVGADLELLRLSLSMNGERRTVNFDLGSGTDHVTSAPVRWAVSTIWAADWIEQSVVVALRRSDPLLRHPRQPGDGDGPAPTVRHPRAMAKRWPASGRWGDELDGHLDVTAGRSSRLSAA